MSFVQAGTWPPSWSFSPLRAAARDLLMSRCLEEANERVFRQLGVPRSLLFTEPERIISEHPIQLALPGNSRGARFAEPTTEHDLETAMSFITRILYDVR